MRQWTLGPNIMAQLTRVGYPPANVIKWLGEPSRRNPSGNIKVGYLLAWARKSMSGKYTDEELLSEIDRLAMTCFLRRQDQ